MALTVETGAIIAGAESYISAADCTTYHDNRGNTAWTGTDVVKESALRKAAAYLDGHYRARWKGRRVSPATQAMEWPRAGVDVSGYEAGCYTAGGFDGMYLELDTIPQRLKDAQCELALRALAADLSTDTSSGVISEKIDIIQTVYNPHSNRQMVYPLVDSLLSDYIRPANNCDAVRG